jgi:hypothetical protein
MPARHFEVVDVAHVHMQPCTCVCSCSTCSCRGPLQTGVLSAVTQQMGLSARGPAHEHALHVHALCCAEALFHNVLGWRNISTLTLLCWECVVVLCLAVAGRTLACSCNACSCPVPLQTGVLSAVTQQMGPSDGGSGPEHALHGHVHVLRSCLCQVCEVSRLAKRLTW